MPDYTIKNLKEVEDMAASQGFGDVQEEYDHLGGYAMIEVTSEEQAREIAQELRETGRPILLAINKADDKRSRDAALEFYRLGFERAKRYLLTGDENGCTPPETAAGGCTTGAETASWMSMP